MPLYNIVCTDCNNKTKSLWKTSAMLEEALKDMECEVCKSKSLKMASHSLSSLKFGGAAKDIIMKERFKKREQRLNQLPEENKIRMKKFMHDYNVKKEY